MENSPASGNVKKLISGTAVLTAAALITKIIGLFYKIPLIKYVGIEGMAYFLAANHIYVLLFVISTSGLPVAVSIMVSEATSEGNEMRAAGIFRTALLLFVLIGGIGTAVMLAAADGISTLINIDGAALCITAIAPAVLMACVSGALRGYFQGRQIMKHTAMSQIIEAAGKLILGLTGAVFAVICRYEPQTVAAFAIAGITAGVGLAMLYLIIVKALYDRKNGFCHPHKVNSGGIAGKLMRIALPITLSSAVISLTGVTDTALIANCLSAAGFSQNIINKLYSCYGNIAVPLFSLTPALISPIAMSVVPMIAAARKSGDSVSQKRAVSSALRLTLLAAIPASAGLSVFSLSLIKLIFRTDAEAAEIAAPLLSVLALSVVSACLITTTNAVLQACGNAGKTIISMLAGATAKIIAELLLVSNPQINILGAPVSTFICNLTVVCINVYYIKKCVPDISGVNISFLKTVLSAFVAVGGAIMLRHIFGDAISEEPATLFAVSAAAIIYLIAAWLSGAVDREMIGEIRGVKK